MSAVAERLLFPAAMSVVVVVVDCVWEGKDGWRSMVVRESDRKRMGHMERMDYSNQPAKATC